MFAAIEPTSTERSEPRPGDGLITSPDVVMDRAFTVPGTPAAVWPWLVQLGKRRAGWYLPTSVERFVPPRRRSLRRIDPRWQTLSPEHVIADYGGREETFTVDEIAPPHVLVYRSTRGTAHVSWSIILRPVRPVGPPQTRVLLRLRMGPVKRVWLLRTGGELIDLLTVAGLAAGLRERLTERRDSV